MHGDIIFQIRDEEAKKTIKDHLKNSEAFTHAMEDLAVRSTDERNKAWALVYELMKQDGDKKLPPGRVYVIDKQARIVDIGPAKLRRYPGDEVDSFLDSDDVIDQD